MPEPRPSRRSFFIVCGVLILLGGATWCAQSAPSARAADDDIPSITTSALINAQLDKQVHLDLNSVLPQAMEKITKTTGVPLRAERVVWDLLPWGQDTNISAKIDNQTLRQALEAITRKLGLTFELQDEYVELQPMPALRRLARRSTVEELAALDALATTTLPEATATRLNVQQLADAVDARLAAIKSPFTLENRTRPEVVHSDQMISIARNSTLSEALEAMARSTPATWYPWGKTIVVLDKQDEIRRQLGKMINVRFTGVDLSQVLAELQHQAGVRFMIDPGALQQVPAESRNIRLVLENSSVQDALDVLSDATGLAFAVEDDGVRVSNPSPAVAVRTPTIGFIQTDTGMQLLVPESQVPPDLREYLNFKMQRALDKIRQQMKDDGFKPTQGADATVPAPGAHTRGASPEPSPPATRPATTQGAAQDL